MNIPLERLKYIQREVLSLLEEANNIILREFPEHHEIAYSFWIPQAVTAIREDEKWLQRGDYSMEKTLRNIAIEKDDV